MPYKEGASSSHGGAPTSGAAATASAGADPRQGILDEATELEEEGFYEEAVEAYMEALSLGLDPQRCHHGAARCYEELSDAEEAARQCTQCLANNPNDVVALTTRGWQYLALSMLMQAKADATAAIALAPSDVEVLDLNEEVQYELSDSAGGAAFDEAQRLYTQGKFGEAISHFSIALDQHYADVFSAYNVRGLCKYNLSQYDDAIADFNHAIAASVDRAAGYYNRGSAYYALGQWEKAEIDATKALELDGDDRAGANSLLETVRKDVDIPPSAQQAYSIAVNLRADKKWAEAADRCGVAIKKFTDPNHRKLCICHIYRGSCFEHLSRCDAALSEYDAALRTNKDDFVGWYLRGHLHKKMGSAKRAREDYEKAIELAPISGDLDEMCDTLVADGMSRGEAMLALSSEKFKRAFKHAAAEEIGEELSKLAFHEAAADAFTLALRSAETSTIPTRHETILKCHRSRSLCYRSMGRHAEALQDINEAVKRAPSDPIGRYYRGLEYMKLCRWREADEDLNKSLELDFGDKPLLRRTVVQAQMQVVQEELSKQQHAAITAEAELLASLDDEGSKEKAKKKKKQAKKKKQKAKKKKEAAQLDVEERKAALVLQALCRRRLAKRLLQQAREEAKERKVRQAREKAEAAEAARRRKAEAERRAKLEAEREAKAKERKEREKREREKREQEKRAAAERAQEARRLAKEKENEAVRLAAEKRRAEESRQAELRSNRPPASK